MAREAKRPPQGSYQVWSRGRTDTWLRGMDFHESDSGWWANGEGWHQVTDHYWIEGKPVPMPTGPKRIAIFESFSKKIGGIDAVVIAKPLGSYLELCRCNSLESLPTKEQNQVDKIVTDFVRQYPKCGSREFNGGMLVESTEVQRCVQTVWAMHESLRVGYYATDIVLKKEKALIKLCDSGCTHLLTRDTTVSDAFQRAYRHHTQQDLELHDCSS